MLNLALATLVKLATTLVHWPRNAPCALVRTRPVEMMISIILRASWRCILRHLLRWPTAARDLLLKSHPPRAYLREARVAPCPPVCYWLLDHAHWGASITPAEIRHTFGAWLIEADEDLVIDLSLPVK